MYCPKCARQIADHSKFCEFCGCKLGDLPVEPAILIDGQPEGGSETAADTKQTAGEAQTAQTGEAQGYQPPQSEPAAQPYQPAGAEYQTPNTVYYAPPAPPKKTGNGVGIASMVVGICSILCCCVPFLGLIAGIVAVVLGIVGLKNPEKGYAIAGIITGGVAVCCGVFMVILAIDGTFTEILNEIAYEYRYYY